MAKGTLSREEAIHKYLHLVKYVAGRIYMHLPANVDINDLINDGVFGLMDALEKYDDSRAVKFETYAITRINGAILDALRSLDWVPRAVRQRAREADRAFEQLEAELGRAPTDEELAQRMNLSVRELDRVRERARASVVSLEEPLPNGAEQKLFVGDTLEDSESDVTVEIERDEQCRELERAVEDLPPQERTVIRRYYFRGEPLKDIKAELGVSESRVSQIHAHAVTHLRHAFCGRDSYLFVVGGEVIVGTLMHEETSAGRGADLHERARRLREVEAIVAGESARLSAARELTQTEEIFGEAQHARRFVLHVRDVVCFAYGEITMQRNAKAEAVAIEYGGRNVIVEAAPIVPLHEDRRRVPELALADRVDERRDPRRSVVRRRS